MRTGVGRCLWAVMLAVVVGAVAWATGCSASHWGGEATQSPGVTVRGGNVWVPPQVSVTADTTAEVESLTYDGGKFELKNGKFGQDATSVTKAQPAKIDAVARLQRTQTEYVAALTEGVRSIVGEVMPVLRILAMAQFADLPGGGVAATLPPSAVPTGASAAQLAEYVKQAVAAAEAIDAAINAPASQPAGK